MVDDASSAQHPGTTGERGDARWVKPSESAVSVDTRLSAVTQQIDNLMSLDTSGKGAVPVLYKAARELYGIPLTLHAAQRLTEAVGPGDVVGIVTGFPSRSFLLEGVTETDGPVGAALLARVLEQALGAIPVIITEHRVRRFSEGCLTAAGMLVTDLDQALQSKNGPHTAACATVVNFPTDHEQAQASASQLLDQSCAKALIAIEQPSVGQDGHAYTAAGRIITDHLLAKMDHLFAAAADSGLLRIGIGDNGNEIGMANITDTIHDKIPLGSRIRAGTACDALIIAGNSNWGAYGLAAAVEILRTGTVTVLPAVDIEAIHRRCVADGAIDGISSRPEPKSDGTPLSANTGVIELMSWISNAMARHQ